MINKEIKETTLVVFARQLAEQMSSLNFLNEWSRSPLQDVLRASSTVLDNHPKHLGSLIMQAYDNSVPKMQSGNINQIDITYPDIFGKSKQYFMDAHEVYDFSLNTKLSDKDLVDEVSVDDKIKNDFSALADTFLQAFRDLNSSQENEHRTLEAVCLASVPAYYAQGFIGTGFNLAEYADQWRTLTEDSRQKLYKDIKQNL